MHKALTAYFQGHVPEYETEHRVLTKSGQWRWILDRGKVFSRDEAGQPVRIASQWLKNVGLELKPSKTRIAHTIESEEGGEGSEKSEGKPGFNFLGFHIRHYRVGKTRACLDRRGKPVGFRVLIKPSKEAIKRHTQKLRETIDDHRSASQESLIDHLNPLIVGWANYYSRVVSKKIFSLLGHIVVAMLLAWGCRRHPNHNKHWVVNKYWRIEEGKGWTFQPRNSPRRLRAHGETPIRRHVKVQGRRSVYDGDWIYWSVRGRHHPDTSPAVARLMEKQKGKCSECGLYFTNGDILEKDHIHPRRQGGTDQDQNRQLLHRHCHHRKTARERVGGTPVKRHAIEEPYDGKPSRTVLKPSRGGDAPA